MKPANTESKSRQARRKSAILAAVSSTLMRITSVVLLLWMRAGRDPASLLSKVFLILIVFCLGSIPLIWISLKTRLKEIQGGEEDAAAQY